MRHAGPIGLGELTGIPSHPTVLLLNIRNVRNLIGVDCDSSLVKFVVFSELALIIFFIYDIK